jgi:hypothetical protein
MIAVMAKIWPKMRTSNVPIAPRVKTARAVAVNAANVVVVAADAVIAVTVQSTPKAAQTATASLPQR